MSVGTARKTKVARPARERAAGASSIDTELSPPCPPEQRARPRAGRFSTAFAREVKGLGGFRRAYHAKAAMRLGSDHSLTHAKAGMAQSVSSDSNQCVSIKPPDICRWGMGWRTFGRVSMMSPETTNRPPGTSPYAKVIEVDLARMAPWIDRIAFWSTTPYRRSVRAISAALATFVRQIGAGPRIVSARDPKRGYRLRLRGILMMVLGGLLVIPAVPVFQGHESAEYKWDVYGYKSLQLPGGEQFDVPLSLIAIAIAIGGVLLLNQGRKTRERGKALLQPTAEELLAVDPRAPVVYLRSFTQDELEVVSTTGMPDPESVLLNRGWEHSERLEIGLARHLAKFGPVVAIGRPLEAEALLGASRAYFSDDAWKSAMAQWMDKARLIVLLAGTSPGLSWELSEIVTRGHGSKLVILFPPRKSYFWGKRARREVALRLDTWQLLAGGMPTTATPDEMKRIALKAAVAMHLRPDGGAVIIAGLTNTVTDFAEVVDLAVYGLFVHDWTR